jgi:hypothetical protein
LADNFGVGETNYQAVLWSLVLVLVLRAKTLALTVVSLSLATTTELDLESAEISPILLDLHEAAARLSSFSSLS